MNKLIYICYVPLTRKFESDLQIGKLRAKGFTVEYWDVTCLFSRSLTVRDSLQGSSVKLISNYRDLVERIEKEDRRRTIFIPQMFYEYRTVRLMRILTSYKCCLAYFAWGVLPTLNEGNASHRLFRYLNLNRLRSAGYALLAKLARKTSYIKAYDLVFAAGIKARDLFTGCSPVVMINHYDYDDYCQDGQPPVELAGKKYCVFLDEGLPDHPDFKLMGIPIIEERKYFTALNRMFGLIEQQYGVEVVIALHPKSTQEKKGFKGRRCFRYRTGELVRGCAFALSHTSTSVNFAVMAGKPVLFLYSDEYRILYAASMFRAVRAFAQTLGAQLYNIDSIYTGEKIRLGAADPDKYRQYRYGYLTSVESERRCTADIIAERLAGKINA